MTEREELLGVWREFYPHISDLKKSSAPYPADWEEVVQAAIYAKRQGHYAGSARIVTDLMVHEGTIYTGALSSLYKTLAAGGLFIQAFTIGVLAKSIYDDNPNPLAAAAGLPSAFDDHLERLKTAMRSETELTSYLRDISGNPNYRLASDYATISAEWRNYTDAMVKGFGTPQKKGGCYIATAVYGSYDAPQVLALRRFRDETLATSSPGRALVKVYYAVSPSLAAVLGRYARPRKASRAVLDRIVRGLN